jgi:hypothetical protein
LIHRKLKASGDEGGRPLAREHLSHLVRLQVGLMRRVEVDVGEEAPSGVLLQPGLDQRQQRLRQRELLPAVNQWLDVGLVVDLLEVQPEPGRRRGIRVGAEHDGRKPGRLEPLGRGEGPFEQGTALVGEVCVGVLGREQRRGGRLRHGILREVPPEDK